MLVIYAFSFVRQEESPWAMVVTLFISQCGWSDFLKWNCASIHQSFSTATLMPTFVSHMTDAQSAVKSKIP